MVTVPVVHTDWQRVNDRIYVRINEIAEEMVDGRRGHADEALIGLEALDGLEQFLSAIKQDLGVGI